ncbi:hypothetical protein F5884DRAFT_160595 [Xylogone sp. PMI_703]|nr:hypothetical protein F5884DRAFT_160595 [Xylogone sp. PMI_703]
MKKAQHGAHGAARQAQASFPNPYTYLRVPETKARGTFVSSLFLLPDFLGGFASPDPARFTSCLGCLVDLCISSQLGLSLWGQTAPAPEDRPVGNQPTNKPINHRFTCGSPALHSGCLISASGSKRVCSSVAVHISTRSFRHYLTSSEMLHRVKLLLEGVLQEVVRTAMRQSLRQCSIWYEQWCYCIAVIIISFQLRTTNTYASYGERSYSLSFDRCQDPGLGSFFFC